LSISGSSWPNRSQEVSGCLFFNISKVSWPNRSQEVSGGSFSTFLGSAGRIALRKPLETHFQHFWGQLAPNRSQEASGGFIFIISGFSWPNRSQETSGRSFSAFLGSAGRVALRKHLEVLFSISWFSWQNRSQEASGGSF
jgi:hypothetical protein